MFLDTSPRLYAYTGGRPFDPARPTVVLLHGFPYDVHAYSEGVPMLADAGCRVVVPYLRGYGGTRFLSTDTPRNAQQGAVATDVIAFMDAGQVNPGHVLVATKRQVETVMELDEAEAAHLFAIATRVAKAVQAGGGDIRGDDNAGATEIEAYGEDAVCFGLLTRWPLHGCKNLLTRSQVGQRGG